MRKVTITEDKIDIEGFNDVCFMEPGKSGLDMGTCRDVGRVATCWALRKLIVDLESDMYGQWDFQISGIAD